MVSAPELPQGVRLNPRLTHEVCEGMSIADTIANMAALGGNRTLLLYPGVYTEPIVMSPGVDIVGVDKELCVINIDHDVLVTMAEGCRLANLTLDVTADAVGSGTGIETNNSNCTIEDVNIILHRTAGAWATGISEDTDDDACIIRIRNVHIAMTANTNERAVWINQPNKEVYIEESWLQGSDYGLAVGISGGAAVDSNVYSYHNHYESTSAASRAVFNDGGLIICHNDDIDIGVSCEDGRVILKNCSYEVINRSVNGNIVDQSPHLQDAPWRVEKWGWMTALAAMDVAVRGTPVDAGSGQVMLEVTDNVAGQEAVEQNTEVAGSLTNAFTRSPRILMQISVDSFDPHVTMFFGLRNAPGNAVPAGEHHAGFIWDGTHFKTSTSNAFTTDTTNLATPSVDTNHQLDILVCPYGTGTIHVDFLLDGDVVSSYTTSVPVLSLRWQHLLATAGAGGGNLVQVTVRNGGCQECPS